MPVFCRMLLMALALAGSVGGGSVATFQAASSNDGPSLRETTDWLASHLVGVNHSSRETVVTYRARKGKDPQEVERLTLNTRESVSGATFEGCALTLTQTTKGDDYTVITVSSVPLDHLLKASVNTEQQQGSKKTEGSDSTQSTIVPASFTSLTLEASSGVITWKRKSTGSVPLPLDILPYEGRGPTLQFNSDDAELPPRLAKAFNHAIKLCQVSSKPEPF